MKNYLEIKKIRKRKLKSKELILRHLLLRIVKKEKTKVAVVVSHHDDSPSIKLRWRYNSVTRFTT